jgi:hypothetical protein
MGVKSTTVVSTELGPTLVEPHSRYCRLTPRTCASRLSCSGVAAPSAVLEPGQMGPWDTGGVGKLSLAVPGAFTGAAYTRAHGHQVDLHPLTSSDAESRARELPPDLSLDLTPAQRAADYRRIPLA